MPDLIPFITRQIGTDSIPTVDARDLYAYLRITKPYTPWIKAQLKRAHLVENIDFTVYSQKGVNPQGGRPAHDYYLSFDAAKHVAMISGASRGHEVRTYFIQKEKELEGLLGSRATPQVKNPAHQMLIEAIVRLDAVEQQAQEAKIEAGQAQANALEAYQRAAQAEAHAQRAYDAKDFWTVAEYMAFEHLEQKIPQREYKALSEHLMAYCLQKGIPFRDISVGGKPWPKEYGYHRSVYTEALTGWLTRRYAQASLHVMHTSEEA